MIKAQAPSSAESSTNAAPRHPIILSIWSVSVDRHEITSRAFFDNCRYSLKDGQPYWRQSWWWGVGGCLHVWWSGGGWCLGVMRVLQCQTDASENWSRGSLLFIDMSKLILIRIWIAMDCVKQQYNREVLKKDCGQRVTLLDKFLIPLKFGHFNKKELLWFFFSGR